jgi:hypothetical protein
LDDKFRRRKEKEIGICGFTIITCLAYQESWEKNKLNE